MLTLRIPRSVTLHIIVVSEIHNLSDHFFLPVVLESLLVIYLNVDNAAVSYSCHFHNVLICMLISVILSDYEMLSEQMSNKSKVNPTPNAFPQSMKG